MRAHLLADFGGEAAGPLFLSESPRNPGAPLRPGAFNDIVDRLRARLALPDLHPHTFRHLRCPVLKRCGVDLADIALVAGLYRLLGLSTLTSWGSQRHSAVRQIRMGQGASTGQRRCESSPIARPACGW